MVNRICDGISIYNGATSSNNSNRVKKSSLSSYNNYINLHINKIKINIFLHIDSKIVNDIFVFYMYCESFYKKRHHND